jgi:hypothetical protein
MSLNREIDEETARLRRAGYRPLDAWAAAFLAALLRSAGRTVFHDVDIPEAER